MRWNFKCLYEEIEDVSTVAVNELTEEQLINNVEMIILGAVFRQDERACAAIFLCLSAQRTQKD